LNQKTIPKYYIFLSLLVLLFLSFTIAFYPQNENINNHLDRMILGMVFISCCIIGISFSIFPGWYKKYLYKKKRIVTQKSKNQVYIQRKGHHPYCNHFKNHTINIQKKTYCAGCLGLTIGAIIAIIMTIGYVFIYNIQQQTYVIFGMGTSLILISFITSLLAETKPVLRVMINILFIIGFFFIIGSAFEHTQNLNFSIISIIFCILFIQTRISLSHNQHRKICQSCSQLCKSYQ